MEGNLSVMTLSDFIFVIFYYLKTINGKNIENSTVDNFGKKFDNFKAHSDSSFLPLNFIQSFKFPLLFAKLSFDLFRLTNSLFVSKDQKEKKGCRKYDEMQQN